MSELQVEGIPEASQEFWDQLLKEELVPVHELFTQVREYQKTLNSRAEWKGDDMDSKLAQQLSETSIKLLGTLNESSPNSTRLLIQAAVRYFVLEEDADSDLDSILGLDDDAEVMNAVLRHLGHDQWSVDIP